MNSVSLSIKLQILTLISLLPTIILGILGKEFKMFIWICDAIVIILSLIIFLKKINKLEKNSVFLILFFIIFIIIQNIAYMMPSKISNVNLLYRVLPLLFFMHFLYSYIFIERSNIGYFKLENYFKFFLVIVIISCFYNIFKNYSMLFNISNITNKYVNISSFFEHRNAFGQFLFLGIISNLYLIYKFKAKKYYLSFALIMFNLIFSFSRTAIFSTLIFLILAFVKIDLGKVKKNQIFIIIFAFISMIFVSYLFFSNDKILNFVEHYILRTDDGVTGRFKLWEMVYHSMNGVRWIIGYGLGSSSNVLYSFGLSNSHNTYIECLLVGGFTALFLYTIIYLSIYKTITKIKNKNTKKIFKAMFFSILIYSFFEKVLLFGTGYASFIFTIFCVILPKMELKNEKKIK